MYIDAPVISKASHVDNIYSIIGKKCKFCPEQSQNLDASMMSYQYITSVSIYKPVREKTNNLVSDQVQHKPYCSVTEDNFGFRKKRNWYIRKAKTKALVSFTVTAKLICVFVFAYADCWFSHAVAHIFPFFISTIFVLLNVRNYKI